MKSWKWTGKWAVPQAALCVCLLAACGGGTVEETGVEAPLPVDSAAVHEITDDDLSALDIRDIGRDGDRLYGPPLVVRALGAQDAAQLFYNGGTWKTDNGADYPPAERYSVMGGYIRNPLDSEVRGWVTDRETLTAVPDGLSSQEGNHVTMLFAAPALPDELTVRAWPVSEWGNLDAEAEEIPAACDGAWSFDLNEGAWIYEIAASWNRWEDPERYEGTGYYEFVGNFHIPEVLSGGELPS